MRYEQPEMEILLFGANVDTIESSPVQSEGVGGGSLDNGDTSEGTWS